MEDGRTVMSQSRRLAAILAADIAGYSALMGSDEARTVSDLKGHQAVVLPMVGELGGRVIDTAGDGMLAEFPSVLNAVECAVAIQRKMVERNAAIEPQRRMEFRIGINLGDVIYDNDRNLRRWRQRRCAAGGNRGTGQYLRFRQGPRRNPRKDRSSL